MTLEEITTLTWAAHTSTGQADDDTTVIDVTDAAIVAIQGDTTPTANTDTDVDINVLTNLDGTNWDTEPIASMNLGDTQIKTILLNPGVKQIKFTTDRNGAGNAAPKVRVAKTRR